MPTKEAIEEFILTTVAKMVTIEPAKELAPHALIFKQGVIKKGKKMVEVTHIGLSLFMGTPMDKAGVVPFLQDLCLAKGVYAVAMVTEAWLAAAPSYMTMANPVVADKDRPSNQAMRKEALIVQFEFDGAAPVTHFAEIRRLVSAQGKRCEVGDWESADNVAGLLTAGGSILPAKQPIGLA